MKRDRIIFWTTTVLFSLLMILSSINYFTNQAATEAFNHLGFPTYFRIELAIAKMVGAIVLVFPFFGSKMKEWVYAGFGITLLSAFIAHINVGDSALEIIAPLIVFLILLVSYVYGNKLRSKAKQL